MGRVGIGRVRDGRAGTVGHREGPDEDEFKKCREVRCRIRRRRAVQARRHFDRIKERPQGRRLLHRCCATRINRFRCCALGAGQPCRRGTRSRDVNAQRRHRKVEAQSTAALDPHEVGRRQPFGRSPNLPLCIPRHLVRGGASRLPRNRTRLVVLRDRRIPRCVDHWLWRCAVDRTPHPPLE